MELTKKQRREEKRCPRCGRIRPKAFVRAAGTADEAWTEYRCCGQTYRRFVRSIDEPLGAVAAHEGEFGRTLRIAALALERAQVGDADEAAALLEQAVTLDGCYVPPPADFIEA